MKMFQFPRFFLWHVFFDGTWLCRCERSTWMKEWRASRRS